MSLETGMIFRGSVTGLRYMLLDHEQVERELNLLKERSLPCLLVNLSEGRVYASGLGNLEVEDESNPR